jgi:RNA polymerase sigma-70 factor, ECF subfamily
MHARLELEQLTNRHGAYVAVDRLDVLIAVRQGEFDQSTQEQRRRSDMLNAARAGDEDAFRVLVDPHRVELHAHCYRMLGSFHDAEDALQDALARAWRGLPKFEGRSSMRSWLYRITTNACVDLIRRRPKRGLGIGRLVSTEPNEETVAPLYQSAWVEPYPDEWLADPDRHSTPEACYDQREAAELAYIAALQHLTGRQRAALILREVLGFSAREAAQLLETTVPSVNSALQRARKTVKERIREPSQQATLRSLSDKRVRDLVERFIDAIETRDVDRILAGLTLDTRFAD